MCVIKVATAAADKSLAFPGQKEIVPWLTCMDSNSDPTKKCDTQVGVSTAAVDECLKSEAPALLAEYLKVDAPIRATPTVAINGKDLKKLSYSAIRGALCEADPSLKGCSAPVPNDADWEPERSYVPAYGDSCPETCSAGHGCGSDCDCVRGKCIFGSEAVAAEHAKVSHPIVV